jgi:glycyl-tRNA synthetase
MESDLATRVDKSSATLGRRYSRADELGVPFAVTVDFDTPVDGCVTMRERDSTLQVRLPKEDVTMIIFKIVHKKMDWEQIKAKYPMVQVDDGEGATDGAPAAEAPGATTKVEATSRGRFSRPVVE